MQGIFWIDTGYEYQLDAKLLLGVERGLGVSVPFDWSSGENALGDCIVRLERSEVFAIQLAAFLIPRVGRDAIEALAEILNAPGSTWEVLEEGEKPKIVIRHGGPVAVVLDELDPSGPSHGHLREALEKLGPPKPEPRTSYLESVKAIEAAVQPVVTPKDLQATLGRVIGVMRGEESSWEVVLGEESVSDVIRRMEIVWKTHHERHGSGTPPPAVTADQARAAFDLAIGLVDYFANGFIRRREV